MGTMIISDAVTGQPIDVLWEGVSTPIPAQSPAAKKQWDDGGPSI